MDLEPDFTKGSTNQYSDGLKIKRITDDKFEVKGLEAGIYKVSVSGTKHNENRDKVMSNHVKVEVFPTVRLAPGDLLIYPGGRWTIEVQGGPEANSRGSVRRSFKIEDEHIATIDQYGEVKGEHVGDTYLTLAMTFVSG